MRWLLLAAELDQVAACVDCGNFDTDDTCRICRNTGRDRSRIRVVEDIADLWAMERAAIYSGLYHVLAGDECNRWRRPRRSAYPSCGSRCC